jgi:hypothetical protein
MGGHADIETTSIYLEIPLFVRPVEAYGDLQKSW